MNIYKNIKYQGGIWPQYSANTISTPRAEKVKSFNEKKSIWASSYFLYFQALAIQGEDWDAPIEGETALVPTATAPVAPRAPSKSAETLLQGLFSGANISGGTFNININM